MVRNGEIFFSGGSDRFRAAIASLASAVQLAPVEEAAGSYESISLLE